MLLEILGFLAVFAPTALATLIVVAVVAGLLWASGLQIELSILGGAVFVLLFLILIVQIISKRNAPEPSGYQ